MRACLSFSPIDQTPDRRKIVGQNDETGNEEDPSWHDGQDQPDHAEDHQEETKKRAQDLSQNDFTLVVGTGRLELPTCRLGGDRSIQTELRPH